MNFRKGPNFGLNVVINIIFEKNNKILITDILVPVLLIRGLILKFQSDTVKINYNLQ